MKQVLIKLNVAYYNCLYTWQK